MPELIVRILGDASQLERTYKKAARDSSKFTKDVERAGRGAAVATIGFRGLGRSVAFASGAFLGGAGLAAAVRAGFQEMFAGQKVAAQTAAALKSTGGIAGVTARQISNLAAAQQQLTGADDEAIQSAENLLLTFTNIRNVVGENNDIFNQATKATLDLSQALGQDLSASAVQLGKALQDPVRGITALRRVGITFTDDQQKLIDRLVRTGNLLDAQKIILREVQREVGNSARAYGQTLPGQLDLLRGNLENLAGELAKTLNPQVKELTKRFNAWLADPENKKKIIDSFSAGIKAIGDTATAAAPAVEGLGRALGELSNPKSPAGRTLKFLLAMPNVFTAAQYAIDNFRKAFGGGGSGGGGGLSVLQGPVGQRSRSGLPPGLQGPVIGAAAPGKAPVPKPPKGITASQRNAWFDAMIADLVDRAQDAPTLRGQITKLRQIAALLRQRLAVTKDVTRTRTLEASLRSVIRQIGDDEDQLTQAAKDATAKARKAAAASLALATERVKAINAAAVAQVKAIDARGRVLKNQRLAREQRDQFRALGLTGEGAERIPGVAADRRRLAALRRDVAGTKVDTPALRARFAKISEVLAGQWGKVTKDTLRAIDDYFRAVRGRLGQGADQVAVAVTPKMGRLLAGLGLSAQQRRRLEFNLAGQHLVMGPGANVGFSVHNHLRVDLDGRQVEAVVRGHAVKAQQRAATQTSGRQTR